jgi:hypothetical protein
MRRRRLVVGALLLALAGAGATFALLPSVGGHVPSTLPTNRGISRIPGMTRIISSGVGSICSFKGTGPLPGWCSVVKLRRGWFEQWILTSAVQRFGRRDMVPLDFARGHPGPAEVSDQVLALGSPSHADLLLSTPDFTGSWDTGRYMLLPAAAVNGGIAGRINPGPDGQDYIRFIWASGANLVEVNVIGVHLTVDEAQRIASLARPR